MLYFLYIYIYFLRRYNEETKFPVTPSFVLYILQQQFRNVMWRYESEKRRVAKFWNEPNKWWLFFDKQAGTIFKSKIFMKFNSWKFGVKFELLPVSLIIKMLDI